MILILKKAGLLINLYDEMRICLICEGLLEESLFQDNSLICRICRTRLKQEEEVNYAEPGQKTIRQAYIDLLLAIHRQARFDCEKEPDALDEWKDYWLKSVEWFHVWELLKISMVQGDSIHGALLSHIGGER